MLSCSARFGERRGSPSSAQNKLVTPEARCILWLADGKQLLVLEPCETVRKLMGTAQ